MVVVSVNFVKNNKIQFNPCGTFHQKTKCKISIKTCMMRSM